MTNRAMTLPEVIIVVGLITIIVGAAITPYIMQQDLLKKQMARNRLQDDISVALAYIAKDVYQAYQVDTAMDNSLVFRIDADPTVNPGPVGLIHEINYVKPDETISKRIDTWTQNADGTTTVEVIGDTIQNIASNMTTFACSSTGNNVINISISGQDETETITMSTSVALRATSAT
ncbi:MAG: prepilin-type N-terminal cleavage/methylation domain-containing protein [Candidatus Omnitrophica bacterium]|nr:prepilin-type N-terminal cleavage/methylation domain-containing protein [Candidatus Omnitrophota bacterium]